MALGEVCCKARCSFKKGQHPLDDPKVELDRGENSDHIICIKLSAKTYIISSQLLQNPERVSLADQGMEAFHHEHEEHGTERVPLSKTMTMENPFPGGAIEKDSSTRSGKNGGDPVGSLAWTPNRDQKF
jgi:hypothetical protein